MWPSRKISMRAWHLCGDSGNGHLGSLGTDEIIWVLEVAAGAVTLAGATLNLGGPGFPAAHAYVQHTGGHPGNSSIVLPQELEERSQDWH